MIKRFVNWLCDKFGDRRELIAKRDYYKELFEGNVKNVNLIASEFCPKDRVYALPGDPV
jgi:hypothetical protein